MQVRVKDGDTYEGVYGGRGTDGGFIIRFARKLEDRSKLVYPPQESITIKAADLIELVARDVDFSLSAHSSERTRGARSLVYSATTVVVSSSLPLVWMWYTCFSVIDFVWHTQKKKVVASALTLR